MAQDYLSPYFETCGGEGDENLGPRHFSTAPARNVQTAKGQLNSAISKFISEADLNKGLDQWLPRPKDPLAGRRVLTDSIFLKIREQLELYGKGEWSLRPRTFAILRMMGCAEALDHFVAEKLTDSLLPYSKSNLPRIIKGDEKRSQFIRLQQMVLCKLGDVSGLEKGGSHINLERIFGDAYFESRGLLGRGHFGKVDRVWSRQTLVEYARKLIHRGSTPLADSKMCRQFENEIQALKRLSHPHIVKLVGSYTDEKHLGLIMTPIADMNLDDFLRSSPIDPIRRKSWMRAFFGCLATALTYLHEKGVIHHDIKSRNVLVKDSCVYLTDFGTSRSWNTGEMSTTLGEHDGFTLRYTAPETFATKGGRKRASDMWSLGCVFLEMATVLLDRSLKELDVFLREHGTLRGDAIWANQEAATEWIEELRKNASTADAKVLDWTEQMLQYDPEDRLTAHELRAEIIEFHGQDVYICHDCASVTGVESSDPGPSQEEVETVIGEADAVVDATSETVDTVEGIQITAEALGIPERPTRHTTPVVAAESPQDENIVDDDDTLTELPSIAHEAPRTVRFEGLPEDRRPEPPSQEQDIDIDQYEILHPEPLCPPPFDQSYTIPKASLVPSYVLAGTNRFSTSEVSTRSGINLFVYGRMMFPSVLRAIAAASTQGAYSRQWRRRLRPSSEDWAKADLSIQRACEAMTPARLEGFDRWRPSGMNCAAIEESQYTPKILKSRRSNGYTDLESPPPGHVDGFLILGVRPEALRYCDLLFNTSRRAMRMMRPESDESDDNDDDSDYEERRGRQFDPLLERKLVEVQIRLSTGELQTVRTSTYVWAKRLSDLTNAWEPERFIRSSPMHSLLRSEATWTKEEQALATTMKTSFAQVGDYLCAPIMEGNIAQLESLLKQRFDANSGCRLYGQPLQAAVAVGREDMVRLLLDNGADVNIKGGQYGTALIAAAYSGRKAITKILLHNSANIFAEDPGHVDALYQAVAHGDYAVAEMLLEHGAWLTQNWTETRDLAAELADGDILALLDQYDVRMIHRHRRALRQTKDEGYCSDEESVDRDSIRDVEKISYSRVLMAVLRKCASLQKASGNWKGRRGVAVVLAALDAGAPLRLLGLLRNAVAPVKAIIELLRKGDEEQEQERQKKNVSSLATPSVVQPSSVRAR